jgi:NADH-quinone oxidoreductase subunit G
MPGADARAMLERPLAGYLLLNCEPWADASQPSALETLAKSRAVVAVTPYASAEMKRVAQVLLPAGSFAETSGTYVNLEGRWQSYAGVAKPLGAARPAWKILRVLGNLLQLADFDYDSSEQVRDALKVRIEAPKQGAAPSADGANAAASWARQGLSADPTFDVGMYEIDPVLRRAGALHRTVEGRGAPAVYASAAP